MSVKSALSFLDKIEENCTRGTPVKTGSKADFEGIFAAIFAPEIKGRLNSLKTITQVTRFLETIFDHFDVVFVNFSEISVGWYYSLSLGGFILAVQYRDDSAVYFSVARPKTYTPHHRFSAGSF